MKFVIKKQQRKLLKDYLQGHC